MDIQRDEDFEKAYSEICKPIIARPYPRNEKGEYIYQEIHEAYLMWQAKAQAVPEVITIGNELQSWVAVWSFSAKNDGEDYVVVDANLLAEKIEKLTGANA